jgi:hypothetical protein
MRVSRSGAAVNRSDVPTTTGDAERGVLVGDREVGPAGRAERTGSFAAVMSGDLGRAGVEQFPRERRLQVTARAERFVTRTGEDADESCVVGAAEVPGIDQLAMCLRPNGIHPLGRLIVMIVTGPRCSKIRCS